MKTAAERREYMRRWRAANPGHSKTTYRRYRELYPERIQKSAQTYKAKHPARIKELAHTARLKRVFGITPEQYDKMLARQGGGCAICGRPPKKNRLAVEHDHGASKRVRGLACHRCNKYKIGTNTAETARLVLAYLESDFDGRNL